MFAFAEMFVFVALVLVGFFYVWKKGALDWSDPTERDGKEGEVKHAAILETHEAFGEIDADRRPRAHRESVPVSQDAKKSSSG